MIEHVRTTSKKRADAGERSAPLTALIVCQRLPARYLGQVAAKNGAQCWITLPGGMQFQPSELTKIFVILTISRYMTKAKQKNESFGFKHFFVIFMIQV